jgi:hypothetical protein
VDHPRTRSPQGITNVLEILLQLFAFVSLAAWGFVAWPTPWNTVVGIAAPAVAILLWALFLSPKAMVRVDPFGRAIVEIVVMAAAALAWWDLGHGVVALLFAAATTAVGIVRGRRELA